MLAHKDIEEFLDYLIKVRKYSGQTVKTYSEALFESAEFVEVFDEDGKTVYDISGYRSKIAALAKKTIAKKVSALRSFFAYKQSMGNKIRTIGDEQIKTPKTLPKPIHKEIIDKALNDIATTEEKLIVLMLYSLGLRISELSAIKLSDISSDWVKVENGKGGKDRMIPLIPEVYEVMNRYRLENGSSFFLLEHDRKPLSQNCLRYKITKIFDRVGYKVTPHQLRHSFATDLINGGARIVDVSELLGHKELATTKIYTKLSMNKKLAGYLNAHPLCKE
jgi:integrase/recombinase XerC